MGKRFIWAILLSWLVLLGWSVLIPKSQPIANKEVKTTNLPEEASLSSTSPFPIQKGKEPPATSLLIIDQQKWELVFAEPQAAIKEVLFKEYQGSKLTLGYGCLLGDASWRFKKSTSRPDSVSFTYKDDNKEIFKEFIFNNFNYTQELRIRIRNIANYSLDIDVPLVLAVVNPKFVQTRYHGITIATDDNVLTINPNKDAKLENIKYFALKDKYFTFIVQTDIENQEGFVNKIDPETTQVGLVLHTGSIAPNSEIERRFFIYLGPQELGIINSINPQWVGLISYGSLDFIAQAMINLLGFFNNILHNWGLAIITLSVIIFLLVLPLTHKQMRSMKAMQILQPKIEEIRRMYKDSPEKINKEIMNLWREHRVNPLSGCLPLILQLPIIFVLFQVLSRHIALKGASFLWIKDLSEPDRLFVLPNSIPILGNEINLLPILVVVGMVIQQKISVSASSTNPQQQKMMMIFMPLIFGFIFYRMPSGLVLYWFVNSSLMLFYQLKVSRAHA